MRIIFTRAVNTKVLTQPDSTGTARGHIFKLYKKALGLILPSTVWEQGG